MGLGTVGPFAQAAADFGHVIWSVGWRDLFKDFAGPVATVTAASVAAKITYTFSKAQRDIAQRQVEINTEKFRHDLFEDRFNVYHTVVDFLYQIESLIKDDPNWTDKFKPFSDGVTMGSFLFPHLKELWEINAERASKVVSDGQMIMSYEKDLNSYRMRLTALELEQNFKIGGGIETAASRAERDEKKANIDAQILNTDQKLVARREALAALVKEIQADLPRIMQSCRPYLEFR
ncbi:MULTISPECIES: hypothetical protein [unclassified Beijerinckia]|uniref:hypothetical protein n=1 Tax=unclassified Beijerinckia TaxID=2638183 RepID=UPI00089A00ED|nr:MULTISPECIES: hypothetical protein [unclassified Beijerinckia]MDH7796448.1 hypothetical protein [Beijerinckia sp. GAS462]SEC45545.1 hypothetical protein SAMN05443249_2730 [Beijerinckia sp. 28-YEA-48]